MSNHKKGTRQQWLQARLQLLEAEKQLTRRSDELAIQRQQLPWVRVDKDYQFDTMDGNLSLPGLFNGRSQLMVYHFMYGPDYKAGCPSCSAIADGFDGIIPHLMNHDVMFWVISRGPLDRLLAYRERMGWTFPWASSMQSDFNFDYSVSFTEEQQKAKAMELNIRKGNVSSRSNDIAATEAAPKAGELIAAGVGTDWATYAREAPGMSSFIMEDGIVYHTYSAYQRGLDVLWGMYQWLDRAPLVRNENKMWIRRHDEY